MRTMTYNTGDLPALLERLHGAVREADTTIINMEHRCADAKHQLADLMATLPWWRTLLWRLPPEVRMARALHRDLALAVGHCRYHRSFLEALRRLVEAAIGLQVRSLSLSSADMEVLGTYGQGEPYDV